MVNFLSKYLNREPEETIVIKKGEDKMGKMDEQILVFEKEAFDFIKPDLVNGLLLINDYYGRDDILDYLNNKWNLHGNVKRRGDMEENPDYKQVIPYTVIKQGNKVFTYSRLNGSGEVRLHDKVSIGVGGHANDVEYPWNFEHILAVNNARELGEELEIKNEKGQEIDYYKLAKNNSYLIGVLLLDDTPVDEVHVGMLNVIQIPNDYYVSVKEKDVLKGECIYINEINVDTLENWSKVSLDALKEL